MLSDAPGPADSRDSLGQANGSSSAVRSGTRLRGWSGQSSMIPVPIQPVRDQNIELGEKVSAQQVQRGPPAAETPRRKATMLGVRVIWAKSAIAGFL